MLDDDGAMKLVKVALACALVLGACSDSGSAPLREHSFGSVQEIVDALAKSKLSCTGLQGSGDTAVPGSDEGTCSIGDQEVSIATFSDAPSRDDFVSASGGLGSSAIVGPNWAVLVDTDALARKVRNALGGTITMPT